MRKLAAACALASLALAAGCGSDSSNSSDSAAGSSSAEATATSSAASSSAPSSAPSSPAGPAGSASTSATPTVLTGSVGTADDPEAFVISLTDSSGQPVSTLPAGDYTVQVTDPATTHNFHLTGAGVDEKTSVPAVEDTTFDVTLTPGEYTFVCDPHPRMTGSFTVT
jgi:plastocyanin